MEHHAGEETNVANHHERRFSTISRFLPLLLLYLLAILFVQQGSALQGDEERYLAFSQNLLQGFYSPSGTLQLWNGPGYPAAITPILLLKMSYLTIRLLNAFLLFGMVIFIYLLLRRYLSEKNACVCSWVAGCYPPFLYHLHLMLAETLSLFLISACSYFFCIYVTEKRSMYGFSAALLLAAACLTKVIFGVVLLVSLVMSLLLLFSKSRRHIIFIPLAALLFCSPYLLYTYSLTGKVLYWSNAGGMQLYWMSTPYPEDYGDWHSTRRVSDYPELRKNHGAFFEELARMRDPVKVDEAFMHKAFSTIATHPGRYLRNWAANVSRMLFGWPYSHRHKPFWQMVAYTLPNLILLFYLTKAFVVRRRESMVSELVMLKIFLLVAFVCTSLVSAYGRSLTPLVPLILILVSIRLYTTPQT